MKSTSIIFAILTLAVLTVSLTASARQVENWSYERLFRESDLVVIAQPVKSAYCVIHILFPVNGAP